jgi:hypothetical protein
MTQMWWPPRCLIGADYRAARPTPPSNRVCGRKFKLQRGWKLLRRPSFRRGASTECSGITLG